MAVQILVAGTVRLTALANVRQGQPSTKAAVQRKLQPGTDIAVIGVGAGETVQGNSLWYQLDGQTFVWSGACGPLTAPTLADGPNGDASTAAPTPAVQPGSSTPPAIPLVIDLYHGDTVTSFAQARAAGVRGIIHKATTGAHGRDNLYDDRRQAATASGMLWGAYHWGTGQPAAQQLDNFLDWAAPDEDTLVALDFERDSGSQMTLDIAREFLDLLHQKLGRRAVIYSGNLIKEQLGSRIDTFFGEHRLWLAQYGPVAKVQRSWSTYWLWQYAERVASIPGLPGNAVGAIDLDHFAGTEQDLATQWAS